MTTLSYKPSSSDDEYLCKFCRQDVGEDLFYRTPDEANVVCAACAKKYKKGKPFEHLKKKYGGKDA